MRLAPAFRTWLRFPLVASTVLVALLVSWPPAHAAGAASTPTTTPTPVPVSQTGAPWPPVDPCLPLAKLVATARATSTPVPAPAPAPAAAPAPGSTPPPIVVPKIRPRALECLEDALSDATGTDRSTLLELVDAWLPEASAVVVSLDVPLDEAGMKVLAEWQRAEGYLFAIKQAGSDPTNPHLDVYAETRFSNLFREDGDTSFLSHSKLFLTGEFRQLLFLPRRQSLQWNNLELFGTVTFRNDSTSEANAGAIVTTTGRAAFEVGIAWRPLRLAQKHFTLGFVAAGGAVSYANDVTPAAGSGLASQRQDHFRGQWRAGLVLRQEMGTLEGTFAEYCWLHDPVFDSPDRFSLHARLVLSPMADKGARFGTYIDLNTAIGSGRDEISLAIGLRLDFLAVARALTGLAK